MAPTSPVGTIRLPRYLDFSFSGDRVEEKLPPDGTTAFTTYLEQIMSNMKPKRRRLEWLKIRRAVPFHDHYLLCWTAAGGSGLEFGSQWADASGPDHVLKDLQLTV